MSLDTHPNIRFALVFTEAGDSTPLREFYEGVLGLPLKVQHGAKWTEFAAGAANIGVHEVELFEDESPALFLSFEVTEIESLHSKLVNAGIQCSAIRAPDRGKFFTCRDPVGTRLHFIEFNESWRSAMNY